VVEVARWPRRGLTDTSHPPSSPPDAACASRLGTRDRHWSPTFPVNGITPITIPRAPLVSLSTTLLNSVFSAQRHQNATSDNQPQLRQLICGLRHIEQPTTRRMSFSRKRLLLLALLTLTKGNAGL
jgi:hypothetical protein